MASEKCHRGQMANGKKNQRWRGEHHLHHQSHSHSRQDTFTSRSPGKCRLRVKEATEVRGTAGTARTICSRKSLNRIRNRPHNTATSLRIGVWNLEIRISHGSIPHFPSTRLLCDRMNPTRSYGVRTTEMWIHQITATLLHSLASIIFCFASHPLINGDFCTGYQT